MAEILIVGDTATNTSDDDLETKLEDAGHIVTRAADEDTESTSGYDLVIISESCSSGTVGTKYMNSNMPVVNAEGFQWDNGGSDAYTSSNAVAESASQTQIDIEDVTSSVPWTDQSVADNVTVLSGAMTIAGQTSTTLGAGAEVVAHKNISAADRAIIFVQEASTTLGGGNTSNARIVGFGFHEEVWGVPNWNASLEGYFDDLANWALGDGHISFIADSTAAATANNTATPTLPTGTQTDDLVMLFVASWADDVAPSAPDGEWTTVGTVTSATGDSKACRLTVFWTIYDGTIDLGVTAANSVPAESHVAVVCATFRGTHTTSPIHASVSDTETTTPSTTITCPAVTTSEDNCMIVPVFANGDYFSATPYSAHTNATLDSLTVGSFNASTAGNDSTLGFAFGVLSTAGSSGTTTVTKAASFEDDAMWTLALQPSGTTPPSSGSSVVGAFAAMI